MSQCKLCGAVDPKFVKSHIIPKSLYGTAIVKEGKPARVFSSSEETRPKRARVGVYDQHLPCDSCEKSFSLVDTYASSLFLATDPAGTIVEHGEPVAYRFEDQNIETIQRFFYSLVWRMGATSREEFGSVNLGKYQQKLGDALLKSFFVEVPEVDVVISRFDTQANGILFPTRLRISGVNGYRAILARHSCWIKVDKRPFPNEFSKVAISTGSPLHMIASDFHSSPEARAMKRLVRRRARR